MVSVVQGGELVVEVCQEAAWTFDVSWCPRSPALLSSSSLEQQVAVHALLAAPQLQPVSAAAAVAVVPGAGRSVSVCVCAERAQAEQHAGVVRRGGVAGRAAECVPRARAAAAAARARARLAAPPARRQLRGKYTHYVILYL